MRGMAHRVLGVAMALAILCAAAPALAQENALPVVDRSIASLSGSSQTLFSDVGTRSITERFVKNESAANSIAINLTGGTAALNTAGSITIAAGGFWSGRVSGKITVIGTAGQPVTAGER
jgi:hypothetical protein